MRQSYNLLELTPHTEIVDEVASMALNKDVSEWEDFLNGLQVSPTPCLEGGVLNTTRSGAFKSPLVDFVSFMLTGVENTDRKRVPRNVYPGAKFCNRDSPHALWHQLSVDSVLELYVIADKSDKI